MIGILDDRGNHLDSKKERLPKGAFSKFKLVFSLNILELRR